MVEPNAADSRLPDPAETARAMAAAAGRARRLVGEFLTRAAANPAFAGLDPLDIGGDFLEMTARMTQGPARPVGANLSLWRDHLSQWQSPETVSSADGSRPDPRWGDGGPFEFIRRSGLLAARLLQGPAFGGGIDLHGARRADFLTRQAFASLGSADLRLTVPDLPQAMLAADGRALVDGLGGLLGEIERQTQGRGAPAAPGSVVFGNGLMELRRFSSADGDGRSPLLLIPPWTGRGDIFDLGPQGSLIRWALGRGHTVFRLDWAGSDLAGFGDYLRAGPLAALDAIERITGARRVDAVAFGLGGTLLAAALAVAAARRDDGFRSATLLSTLADFAGAGELGVFIGEEQLAGLEAGGDRTQTVARLRAIDPIWSFTLGRFLAGSTPFPDELLRWIAESVPVPAALHRFVLSRICHDNQLVVPGALVADGVPIDLGAVATPLYLLSGRDDLITPWRAAYGLGQPVAGPVRFVLAASGHFGAVAPAESAGSCFWTNPRRPKTPDSWLGGATRQGGWWWSDWGDWLERLGSPN